MSFLNYHQCLCLQVHQIKFYRITCQKLTPNQPIKRVCTDMTNFKDLNQTTINISKRIKVCSHFSVKWWILNYQSYNRIILLNKWWDRLITLKGCKMKSNKMNYLLDSKPLSLILKILLLLNLISRIKGSLIC